MKFKRKCLLNIFTLYVQKYLWVIPWNILHPFISEPLKNFLSYKHGLQPFIPTVDFNESLDALPQLNIRMSSRTNSGKCMPEAISELNVWYNLSFTEALRRHFVPKSPLNIFFLLSICVNSTFGFFKDIIKCGLYFS